MDVIAVDWSGAKKGASRHIWMARVRDGTLIELRNGLERPELVAHLIATRTEHPDGLVVGLDFAFSFPLWFLEQRGYRTTAELWLAAADHGEDWLATCQPPFWGRPGRRRPDLPAHLRKAEESAAVGGIRAQSVFQIGGAGAVGTGSVRGMPYLTRLAQGGFSIWPFDPPSPWRVVEIYPRLLTGAVHKRNPDDRMRYLADAAWDNSRAMAAKMEASEDAFDAAISALVMDRHIGELTALVQASDPRLLREGEIFVPNSITS